MQIFTDWFCNAGEQDADISYEEHGSKEDEITCDCRKNGNENDLHFRLENGSYVYYVKNQYDD